MSASSSPPPRRCSRRSRRRCARPGRSSAASTRRARLGCGLCRDVLRRKPGTGRDTYLASCLGIQSIRRGGTKAVPAWAPRRASGEATRGPITLGGTRAVARGSARRSAGSSGRCCRRPRGPRRATWAGPRRAGSLQGPTACFPAAPRPCTQTPRDVFGRSAWRVASTPSSRWESTSAATSKGKCWHSTRHSITRSGTCLELELSGSSCTSPCTIARGTT
mmetsp:Transcript_92257/g.296613  ORF Transcript_92257/g.296613 Transcript_92257/m.296613 type:complete len:220 (+) Transcript_92257:510-1169(+)